MEKVVDIQVGGDHYRGEFQPIQLFALVGFGTANFACNTIKYLRHKKKNGVQDLNKGLHYNSMQTDELGLKEVYGNIKKYEDENDMMEKSREYLHYLPIEICSRLSPSNIATFCYYAECNDMNDMEASIVALSVITASSYPMHPMPSTELGVSELADLLNIYKEECYPNE